MRGNRLSGAIPPGSIGLLPALTILDLSDNELTGSNVFNMLNLSSNQLTAEVPAQLQTAAYDQLPRQPPLRPGGLRHEPPDVPRRRPGEPRRAFQGPDHPLRELCRGWVQAKFKVNEKVDVYSFGVVLLELNYNR
ncbi:hypothetical protein BDA96_10G220400 [Sorghum bicolor]|jgi:hypothetical protein|nr:hypothetical protein BDA96_10G220400 [Sorghum bicolor]